MPSLGDAQHTETISQTKVGWLRVVPKLLTGDFASSHTRRASAQHFHLRLRCVGVLHNQPPASHSPCSALTNARAFFTDHCSLPEPSRATCPFWHWKPLSFAVFSQLMMPV